MRRGPNFTLRDRGVNARLAKFLNSVLNVKVQADAFNQEKALVEAFSVIVRTSCYLREPLFEALVDSRYQLDRGGAKHAATPTLSSNPHPLLRQLPPARATHQCSATLHN